MMGLYEIATGYIGCSFERCYVWASSKERAIEMFRERFTSHEPKEVRLIVRADEPEFMTELCDEGFGDRLESKRPTEAVDGLNKLLNHYQELNSSLLKRIDQLEREKRGIGPEDQYA